VAALVLVGLTLAIFARGLRGPAVTATVIDDAVVGWLAGLVGPGAAPLLRGVARISSWWVLWTLSYGLLLTLAVLRRWRHLLVWFVAVQLGSNLIVGLAMITRRPRPFGVELQTSWGGWALPSLQVAFLTGILMGMLYTLVPEGRWRNTGKWVAAALITLVAAARMALGVDAPTDVLVGVGIGVTIPLLLFRRFPEGDDQRHGQHAQVLEGEHWPVQPVGQPVDGVEGGPLDGPDPPIGDDHRADREHRQAGHEQHDVAPNPVHGTSPPSPPLRSLGTRSQRRSSHHAASRLDLPTVRIPPEGSAREYLALRPSTSERSLGDNRSWRFNSRARRAVQAPLL
jgi:membrane-associated phospholipid phosphatase